MTGESTLTRQQYKNYGPRPVRGYRDGAAIWALVRFDDECGNGHNTFSITGTVQVPRQREPAAGGCLHDEIAEAFPELAPLIKWHLCSTDGPLHYVANTVYQAGERDHWGLLKGEFRQFVDKETGLPQWELGVTCEDVHRKVKSAERPSPVTFEYRPWGMTGEGKERNLDAARRSAVWPEATDEELTAPGLKERLEARLPALLAEFRAAVESLGFVW